jgi:hypothetical protein
LEEVQSLDRERDAVTEPNGVEYQAILYLEVIRGLPLLGGLEADADRVVSFVNA